MRVPSGEAEWFSFSVPSSSSSRCDSEHFAGSKGQFGEDEGLLGRRLLPWSEHPRKRTQESHRCLRKALQAEGSQVVSPITQIRVVWCRTSWLQLNWFSQGSAWILSFRYVASIMETFILFRRFAKLPEVKSPKQETMDFWMELLLQMYKPTASTACCPVRQQPNTPNRVFMKEI